MVPAPATAAPTSLSSSARPARPARSPSPRPSRQQAAPSASAPTPRPISPSLKAPSRPRSPFLKTATRRTSPERATLIRSKPDSPLSRTPRYRSPPPRSPRDRSPMSSNRIRDMPPRGPRDGTPKRPLSPARAQHPSVDDHRDRDSRDTRPARGHSPIRTSAARIRTPPRGPAADRRGHSPPRQPRALPPRDRSPMQIDSKDVASRDTPSRPNDHQAKTPITPLGPRAGPRGPAPSTTTPAPSGATDSSFAPPTGPKNMVVPTGPRAGGYHHHTPYRGGYHGNSTSHPPPPPRQPQQPPPLIVGPPIIKGGQLLPPINAEASERLHRLRIDQVKLDEEVRVASDKLRKSLIEWDKGELELQIVSTRLDIWEKAAEEGYVEDPDLEGYSNGTHEK
ncbi:hypothetical protein TWF106_000938 [Orbilia oligospora]|nr:hypothetical protein TWF106_000938 [Orbilia oligospora]KAF3233808.1 hypothetical protein TWF192_001998 [Orbilia oligospora]